MYLCVVILTFVDCFVFTVPPSPELVERVRDLYHKRVPDVRFLIPVINGLEKVCLMSYVLLKNKY